MLIKITASRSELWFTYSLIVIWIKKYMLFNEFMQNSKTRIKVEHIQSLHNASKIFFFYFAFLQLVRWWIVWRRRNDFDIKLQFLLIINWIVYDRTTMIIALHSCCVIFYSIMHVDKYGNRTKSARITCSSEIRPAVHCIVMWTLNHACVCARVQWENAVSIVHASRNTHAVMEFTNSNLYSALI